MFLRILCFICLQFLLGEVFCQSTQDSLFKSSDLKFSSNFERDLFNHTLEGDYFSGFMVLSDFDSLDVVKWKDFFDHKIAELRAIKRPKKDEKYVKVVYDFVHDTFLRKYETNAYFHQIFENGVYNCVTACAIYALVFDEIGIPYTIKETPSHVYIITYPDSYQIVIETTDPVSGYMTFSPGFKEGFVSLLTTSKLIDISELSSGVNTVFDKYYFTKIDLDLKQLTGIQYYNQGIEKLDTKDYYAAFSSLQKAHYLYPYERINKTALLACISHVSKSDYTEITDIEILSFLPLFADEEITEAEVVQEFGRLLNLSLVKRNDTVYARRAFEMLVPNMMKEESVSELNFIYNYERGRLLYNRASYRDAQPFAEKAYAAQPGNADAENLLSGNINNMLVSKSVNTDEGLKLIESLYSNYPGLITNGHISKLLLSLYLDGMATNFDNRKPSAATEYKEKFEKHVSENPGASFSEYEVGRAYSKGVVYYFRLGRYSSARSVLTTGLQYAPDSQELRMRKYMLNTNAD